MERVFSVDDILGTFWKLDTQGENGQPSQMGHFGSQLDLQKLYREQPTPSGGTPYTAGMVHSSSFHRMNRSSSEWAFQEFLKEHVSPKGKKPRQARSGRIEGDDSDSQKSESADEDEHRTQSQAAKEKDSTQVQGGNVDTNSQAPVRSNIEGSPSRESFSITPYIDPISESVGNRLGKEISSQAYQNIPYPTLMNPRQSQGEQLDGRNPVREADDTAGQHFFQLNPGGPVPDPQQYERMLKQQLATACAMAKTRGRSSPPASGPVLSRPQPVHPGMSYPSISHYGMLSSYMPPYLHGGMPMHEGSFHPQASGAMTPASPPPPLAPPEGQAPGGPSTKGMNHVRNSSAANGGLSSREHSDDDEGKSEGENELVASLEHVTDPDEIKRIKRMLSNRESARRSRRRKQAHMSDLETQVAHLQAENSNLSSRLTDIGRKYNEAAVDNRVLKSDVEALRAKVKMAEEMVSRSHHMAQYLYGGPHHPPSYRPSLDNPSHMPPGDIPYYPRPLRPGQMSPPPPHPSGDMPGPLPLHQFPPHLPPPPHFLHHPHGLPMPPRSSHHQHMPYGPGGPGGPHGHEMGPPPHRPGTASPPLPVDMSGMGAMRIERSPSMQRVASLEHLQKRIRGPSSLGPWNGVWEDPSGGMNVGGGSLSGLPENGSSQKEGDPKDR